MASDAFVDEGTRGLDLGNHFRQLEFCVLKIKHRLAEGTPFLDIIEGLVDGGLGEDDRAHGDDQPFADQSVHQYAPAVVLIAEPVMVGHRNAVEEQLRRVLRLVADLLEIAPARHPVGAEIHPKQGNPFCAQRRIGFRRQ